MLVTDVSAFHGFFLESAHVGSGHAVQDVAVTLRIGNKPHTTIIACLWFKALL